MRSNLPVTQREYELRDGMTIVSRTDLKGRITFINHDFIEASGFAEAELIGQPHNMVRHPDMPEQAFDDLWRTLKAGRPWTGLVKNRCKNGDFYWVVANVTPLLEGSDVVGYLSVRTRPTREQVQASEAAYRRFREGKAEGLTIRDGEVVPCGKPAWADRLSAFPMQHRATGIAMSVSVAMILGVAAGHWHAWWLVLPGVLLLGAAAWVGTRMLARASRGLADAAAWLDRFGQARFDGLVVTGGEDEVAHVMRSLRRVQVRLGFEVADTARRAAEAERIRQKYSDRIPVS